MVSTGWLKREALGWWAVEFECPTHGPQLVVGKPWRELIDEVVREAGLRLYSRDLAGHSNPNCPMSHCPETGTSTGWLELNALGDWAMEFECPRDGTWLVSGGSWAELIARVAHDRAPGS